MPVIDLTKVCALCDDVFSCLNENKSFHDDITGIMLIESFKCLKYAYMFKYRSDRYFATVKSTIKCNKPTIEININNVVEMCNALKDVRKELEINPTSNCCAHGIENTSIFKTFKWRRYFFGYSFEDSTLRFILDNPDLMIIVIFGEKRDPDLNIFK